MGLDMYLRGNKFRTYRATELKEDGFNVKNIILELGYWRKHPDLHGYIVATFADGVDECQEIEIDLDGLDQIIAAVTENRLPHTEGFFFGGSYASHPEASEEDKLAEKNEDLQILNGAKAWLLASKDNPDQCWRLVIYQASW